MKILKYKKLSNGIYELYLEDGSTYKLYEEVILKYDLLLDKEISINNKELIDIYNNYCSLYYKALKSLKSKFKSIYELKKYLTKDDNNLDNVELVINKLLDQGYLNDDLFSKSYINNQIISNMKGPLKIKRELKTKGVDDKYINSNILEFTLDMQVEKINKLISKMLKMNKNKGGEVLKKKIVSYLVNMGYDISIINSQLLNYSFNVDKNIYNKEYNKLYKKLSKKYSGDELEYKIKEKLYLKGLYLNK